MKVGVIGAGTMGSGIAQAFAQTEGYEVMLSISMRRLLQMVKIKLQKGLKKGSPRGR